VTTSPDRIAIQRPGLPGNVSFPKRYPPSTASIARVISDIARRVGARMCRRPGREGEAASAPGSARVAAERRADRVGGDDRIDESRPYRSYLVW